MSKRLFLKKFLFNNRETGSIMPSSKTLANKMVKKKYIEESNVIIELWAWWWIFTKYIFEYSGNKLEEKKIFIIEKDKDFYELLLLKFPQYSDYIYNIDVLDLNKLLIENNIKHIDLVISWLPFKSLPKEIYDFLMIDLFKKYFTKNTLFVQFSYFKNFANDLSQIFENINISKCLFNIPSAYVFECNLLKNEKK